MRIQRTQLRLLGSALILSLLVAALPLNAQRPINCRKVLEADDIASLLDAGVPIGRVKLFVTTCKVTFELSDSQEARFRSLGATDAIILAIVRNHKPPAPPPPPSLAGPTGSEEQYKLAEKHYEGKGTSKDYGSLHLVSASGQPGPSKSAVQNGLALGQRLRHTKE